MLIEGGIQVKKLVLLQLVILLLYFPMTIKAETANEVSLTEWEKMYLSAFCANRMSEHGRIGDNIAILQGICDEYNMDIEFSYSLDAIDWYTGEFRFCYHFGDFITIELTTEPVVLEDLWDAYALEGRSDATDVLSAIMNGEYAPETILSTYGDLQTEGIDLVLAPPFENSDSFHSITINMFKDQILDSSQDAVPFVVVVYDDGTAGVVLPSSDSGLVVDNVDVVIFDAEADQDAP